MLKDITLGQYYPRDSIIHKLDPRVKLLGTLIYIICVFLFHGVIGFLFASFILIGLIKLSKVPYQFMLKGVRAIWLLIVITAAANLFFSNGHVDYVRFHAFHISDTGVHNAIYYSIRLVYLVIGSSIMTLTTSPNKMTDGLETGLRVLNRIHFPIHEMAMMMSIALRFVPILGEEAEKIKRAQQARGAAFDKGNLLQRAKSMIPILVPLFVSSFQRAQDLSLAMEARCYKGGELSLIHI